MSNHIGPSLRLKALLCLSGSAKCWDGRFCCACLVQGKHAGKHVSFLALCAFCEPAVQCNRLRLVCTLRSNIYLRNELLFSTTLKCCSKI